MSELREIRKQRGLTLEQVGFLASVDAATVSRIENGHVQPKPETLVSIAKALGISVRRIAPRQEETVK